MPAIYQPVLNQRQNAPQQPSDPRERLSPQSPGNQQSATPQEGGFQQPSIPYVSRPTNETDLSHNMYAPTISPPTSRPAGQSLPPLVSRVDPMRQTAMQVHKPLNVPALPSLYARPSSGFTKPAAQPDVKSLFTPAARPRTMNASTRLAQPPAPEQPETTGLNDRLGGTSTFNRKARGNALPAIRNILQPMAGAPLGM